MSSRPLMAISVLAAAAGIVVAILGWIEVIEWDHTDSLVAILLFMSLFCLGAAAVVGLRRISRDMELLRQRTKNTAENTMRASSRIEEVRRELMLGTFSHLPGQVGRIEGQLRRGSGAAEETPGPVGTTVNAVFDAVFVINLPADQARFAHVAEMLTEHGIEFERFPASDGADPQYDLEWERYSTSGLQLPREQYTGQRLIESRGAFGYLKTMERLLTEAQQRGLGMILVLEDDIMLHKTFAELFTDIWAEVPGDWKLVYLGSAQVDRDKIVPFAAHLYHPGAMANGSYAIALHSSVFDQALAAIERLDWPFDAGALREIDAAYPSQTFAVDPPLVIADVSRSAIRPGRDLEAHSRKHGWNLDDYAAPFVATD
ncbi:MAG: glycosyltransferase family 25 protein [Acidimicrobiia bacterium]|nr:glycosyltransferase family 25 protein [Acidimicrobiia bacterium]